MELFYAYKIEDGFAWLDAEESAHCVRVLRHRTGDEIAVIAGLPVIAGPTGNPPTSTVIAGPTGNPPTSTVIAGSTGNPPALYRCVITDESPKGVVARVEAVQEGWGSHPYYLRMAVCPTKNIDRYEWFVEKAVELGVDEIVPVIGEHSERRVVRVDRLQKIAISAAKQSLKGCIPVIAEPISVLDFISCHSERSEGISLIAYCSDDVAPRGSIVDALTAAFPSAVGKGRVMPSPKIGRFSGAPECTPKEGARYTHSPAVETLSHAAVSVLIGPEGDFSKEEVQAAIAAGFEPVHLGPSRLRTETAAITAVEAAYLTLGLGSTPYNSQ